MAGAGEVYSSHGVWGTFEWNLLNHNLIFHILEGEEQEMFGESILSYHT